MVRRLPFQMMARFITHCRFAKRSIESVLFLALVVLATTTIHSDQFVEVDWTISSTGCVVDSEENNNQSELGNGGFIDLVDFDVNTRQGDGAVATSLDNACDFWEVIPKYVLYSRLKLDC